MQTPIMWFQNIEGQSIYIDAMAITKIEHNEKEKCMVLSVHPDPTPVAVTCKDAEQFEETVALWWKLKWPRPIIHPPRRR